MPKKPAAAELTEQRLRVFAVRMATILGEHAARLTNLELFLKARRSVNQHGTEVLPPFSKPGYVMVAEMVRDEILHELFPEEEAEAEAVADGRTSLPT